MSESRTIVDTGTVVVTRYQADGVTGVRMRSRTTGQSMELPWNLWCRLVVKSADYLLLLNEEATETPATAAAVTRERFGS